jgi:hypothetical protein
MEDFEEKVRSGYYRLVRENNYLRKNAGLEQVPETFGVDLERYLFANGVPAKYVGKVGNYCYREGHSSGEEEIFNVALDMLEIFVENPW